jgi:hypothetical protein
MTKDYLPPQRLSGCPKEKIFAPVGNQTPNIQPKAGHCGLSYVTVLVDQVVQSALHYLSYRCCGLCGSCSYCIKFCIVIVWVDRPPTGQEILDSFPSATSFSEH